MSTLRTNTLQTLNEEYSVDVEELVRMKNRNVNVNDYGADSTGVIDCLTAFNNSVTAAGDGIVEITQGTYNLSAATSSATWLIYPGVTITGLSNAGTAGGGVPDFSRLTGRVYNLSAGGQMGMKMGSSSSWLTSDFRDPIEYISETVSVAKQGGYGLVGASRASDDPTANMNTIGVGAFGYNDYATAPNPVWATYMEGRRIEGAGPVFGIELDFLNKGTDFTETPYNTIDGYSANSPVVGIRLSAGAGVGGNPCSTGIDFSPNGTTWNTGILFRAGSLTDNVAIGMPATYSLKYYDTDGDTIGVMNGYGRDLTDVGGANYTCVTDSMTRNRTTGTTLDGDYIYRLTGNHYPNGSAVAGNEIRFKQISTYRTSTVITANNDTQTAVGFSINEVANNSITPTVDASLSLGSASYRWAQIYSSTSSISTSDGTLKTDVRTLSDAEKNVAVKIKGLIKVFRFIEEKEKKGDDARLHTGVIAQEVISAFQEENLDPFRYGIVCLDSWDATPEQIDDETGKVLVEARAAGQRYGIRYEELMCFVIASI